MRLANGAFEEAADDALDPHEVVDYTGDPVWESRTPPDGWKFSWNAPICERCWLDQRGFTQPVRVRRDDDNGGADVCAFCGRPTWARILVRADPTKVPYPRMEPLDG